MTVKEFAEAACRNMCDRCDDGHYAFKEGENIWTHGVDQCGNTTFNPEQCPASIIHEMMLAQGMKETVNGYEVARIC